MTNKPTTLRERFFNNLTAIRWRDSESKNKSNRELIKRVKKRVATKNTA